MSKSIMSSDDDDDDYDYSVATRKRQKRKSGKNHQLDGFCSVCWLEDGNRGMTLQSCRQCGVLVHSECYGRDNDGKQRLKNFVCWACLAQGQRVTGRTRQGDDNQDHCHRLCSVNITNVPLAMHPVYDYHGKTGRQLILQQSGGEKRAAFCHTKGTVYGCTRHGRQYRRGVDVLLDAEEDSRGNLSANSDLEDGDNDTADELHHFVYVLKERYIRETEWLRAIRMQQERFKCHICGRDDNRDGVLRIALQCDANSSNDANPQRQEYSGLWRSNGDTCSEAMHVGCAIWGCGDKGKWPDTRRVFFEDKSKTKRLLCNCFCRVHAEDWAKAGKPGTERRAVGYPAGVNPIIAAVAPHKRDDADLFEDDIGSMDDDSSSSDEESEPWRKAATCKRSRSPAAPSNRRKFHRTLTDRRAAGSRMQSSRGGESASATQVTTQSLVTASRPASKSRRMQLSKGKVANKRRAEDDWDSDYSSREGKGRQREKHDDRIAQRKNDSAKKPPVIEILSSSSSDEEDDEEHKEQLLAVSAVQKVSRPECVRDIADNDSRSSSSSPPSAASSGQDSAPARERSELRAKPTLAAAVDASPDMDPSSTPTGTNGRSATADSAATSSAPDRENAMGCEEDDNRDRRSTAQPAPAQLRSPRRQPDNVEDHPNEVSMVSGHRLRHQQRRRSTNPRRERHPQPRRHYIRGLAESQSDSPERFDDFRNGYTARRKDIDDLLGVSINDLWDIFKESGDVAALFVNSAGLEGQRSEPRPGKSLANLMNGLQSISDEASPRRREDYLAGYRAMDLDFESLSGGKSALQLWEQIQRASECEERPHDRARRQTCPGEDHRTRTSASLGANDPTEYNGEERSLSPLRQGGPMLSQRGDSDSISAQQKQIGSLHGNADTARRRLQQPEGRHYRESGPDLPHSPDEGKSKSAEAENVLVSELLSAAESTSRERADTTGSMQSRASHESSQSQDAYSLQQEEPIQKMKRPAVAPEDSSNRSILASAQQAQHNPRDSALQPPSNSATSASATRGISVASSRCAGRAPNASPPANSTIAESPGCDAESNETTFFQKSDSVREAPTQPVASEFHPSQSASRPAEDKTQSTQISLGMDPRQAAGTEPSTDSLHDTLAQAAKRRTSTRKNGNKIRPSHLQQGRKRHEIAAKAARDNGDEGFMETLVADVAERLAKVDKDRRKTVTGAIRRLWAKRSECQHLSKDEFSDLWMKVIKKVSELNGSSITAVRDSWPVAYILILKLMLVAR